MSNEKDLKSQEPSGCETWGGDTWESPMPNSGIISAGMMMTIIHNCFQLVIIHRTQENITNQLLRNLISENTNKYEK